MLFEYHKYLWSSGDKVRALSSLTDFLASGPQSMQLLSLGATDSSTNSLSSMVGAFGSGGTSYGSSSQSHYHHQQQQQQHRQQQQNQADPSASFRVRCLLKRAEWMRELDEDDDDILRTVHEARELASGHYSVWHAWAVTNYDQLKRVIDLGIMADGNGASSGDGDMVHN